MSTILMPDMPAATPEETRTRYPAVFANLLPDEVIVGRRARKLRKQLAAGLCVLVVLLIAWYGYAKLQTHNANNDLAAANRTASSLESQQQKFGPLLRTQGESAAINARLTQLMRGDVQWSKLLDGVRAVAPKGVSVATISAQLVASGSNSTATSNNGGLAILNTTGKAAIGTLTLSGSSSDKTSVAAFVDALPSVPGVAAAFPQAVEGSGSAYTWTITAILTSDALGGRFSPTAAGGH